MTTEYCECQLPAVALRGMTILPNIIIHFDLSRKKSIQAVEQAMQADQRLLVVTQLDANTEDPAIEDVYEMGTIVNIRQLTKLPGGVVRVLVEGKMRAQVLCFREEITDYILAGVEELPKAEPIEEPENEAMLRELRSTFEKYSRCFPKIGKNHSLKKHLPGRCF